MRKLYILELAVALWLCMAGSVSAEILHMGMRGAAVESLQNDLVVEELSPIRSRYDELTGTPELDAILDDGAVRARAKARVTYENAIHAMGLYRK